LNRAELSIPAGNPDGIVPGVANIAWRGNWSSRVRSLPSWFIPVVAIPAVSFQSRLAGVAHAARLDCAVSVSATPRECRIPDDSASSARGAPHPASAATFSKHTCTLRPSGVLPVTVVSGGATRPPLGVFGVGHPAGVAVCPRFIPNPFPLLC